MAAAVFVIVSGGMENLVTGEIVGGQGLMPSAQLRPSETLTPAGE